MPFAAARIAVDLIHECSHTMDAVADNMRGFAPRCCNDVFANHEQTMIMAGDEAFHHHFAADFSRCCVGDIEMITGNDVYGHSFALITVARFDHHRQSDFAGGCPGIVFIRYGAADRYRNAGSLQQFFSELLILRDGLGNGAAAIGFGSLDAALTAAPAELHQAAVGEAPVGNAARDCGLNNGGGAGPEANIFVQFMQPGEGGIQIEGQVFCCGVTQCFSKFESEAADRFFRVFDDYLVEARFHRLCDMHKGDRATCLCLQAEDGESEGMRNRNFTFVANGTQCADFRETCSQPRFQARHPGDVALFGRASHQRFEAGVSAPQIGAAQCADACDFHGPVFLWFLWTFINVA